MIKNPNEYIGEHIGNELEPMSIDEFIAFFHKVRKESKNRWVWFRGKVGDKMVIGKSFNTWVQRVSILDKDSCLLAQDGSLMDRKVWEITKYWKELLESHV